LMISSNALGQCELSRSHNADTTEKEKTHALDNDMRTIKRAYGNEKKVRGLAHCPATSLVNRDPVEDSPIREGSDLRGYSPSHYQGFFHTDHLVPSVFFNKERVHKELKSYDDLSLRYIYDPVGDPQD